METADALDYCRLQVKTYDLDRYLSALFARSADRRHLFALYAFNLEIAKTRESVTEPVLGQIRLQWWREAVDEIYRGRSRRHEVVAALADAVEARGLSRALLDRMIDGRERDLLDEPPATVADLEEYCDATSSTLMMLALQALGAPEQPARDAAWHGGIAWAITGHLRSLPFHLAQRRHFLPRRLLNDAGVGEGALFGTPPPEGLGTVIAELVRHARAHLVEARRRRRVIAPAARNALLHLALADVNLRRMEVAGFDPFAQRIEISPPMRQMRLLWAASFNRY